MRLTPLQRHKKNSYSPLASIVSSGIGMTQIKFNTSMFMLPAHLPPSAWTGHIPFAGWLVEGLQPRILAELGTPYELPRASRSVGLVISRQAFEHAEYFWLIWMEMLRILKPGGMVFLIAPSRGAEHRYSQDCWRFYPDGFRALARFSNCELLEVGTDWEQPPPDPGSDWGDTVGEFRPRPATLPQKLVRWLATTAMQWQARTA